MADAFTLGFPVKFESGGDTTRDAFGKHRQEINKIYTHLNWLNTHKVEASEVNGQIAGVESKLTTHINSSNPHPNYTPPVPSLDSLSGTLDISKITGNFGTDRITGLESYVKGLISDNGDGVTERVLNGNGYMKYSNGLILQWGVGQSYDNTTDWKVPKKEIFAKKFDAVCFVVLLTGYYGDITNDGNTARNFYAHLEEKMLDGFTWKKWGMSTDFYGSDYKGKYHVEYIAIGR